MEKYRLSNYASNKYKDGIVYHFQDGSSIEISLEDYLKENPDRTESDFLALKEISDNIYHEQVIEEHRYERRRQSLGKLEQSLRYATPSLYISYMEHEEQRRIAEAAQRLLTSDLLTEIQKRRFIRHFIEGMSYRQIAVIEGVHFTAVYRSIKFSIKKFKKYLIIEI